MIHRTDEPHGLRVSHFSNPSMHLSSCEPGRCFSLIAFLSLGVKPSSNITASRSAGCLRDVILLHM